MKTDQEIVESANALARKFYSALGYRVPAGYRFDKASHPQERACWNMAGIAFDHIEGTDVSEALAATEDAPC